MCQAIFKRIWIHEDETVTTDFTDIYKNIVGPIEHDLINQNTKSASAEADADSIHKLLKSYSNFFGQGLNNELLVGLSEINSKNYDIILGKVKSTPVTPVTSSSMSEYPDNAYNIKTEIKQQQKHLSNKEISEIVVKYSSGISTYELAKEYGCHRRTISDNLKKQGIKVTNQLMERKGVVELVIQMYSEYIKPADIAKAVGINVDSVRKILKENNVYIRKSWEYPRK